MWYIHKIKEGRTIQYLYSRNEKPNFGGLLLDKKALEYVSKDSSTKYRTWKKEGFGDYLLESSKKFK